MPGEVLPKVQSASAGRFVQFVQTYLTLQHVRVCSSVVKIDQFRLLRNVSWLESYMAALLETDWKKMRERVHASEAEIRERQRVLSEDHGGSAEERQAIVDAISGMNVLRSVATNWKNQQVSEP